MLIRAALKTHLSTLCPEMCGGNTCRSWDRPGHLFISSHCSHARGRVPSEEYKVSELSGFDDVSAWPLPLRLPEQLSQGFAPREGTVASPFTRRSDRQTSGTLTVLLRLLLSARCTSACNEGCAAPEGGTGQASKESGCLRWISTDARNGPETARLSSWADRRPRRKSLSHQEEPQ